MKKSKKETKAERLRRLKSQGRYLAAVCHLPKNKRKKIAEHRDKYGIRAALQLAKSYTKKAA